MRKLEIKDRNFKYDIIIGKNIFETLSNDITNYDKVLILTNKTIAKLYDNIINKFMDNSKIYFFEIEDGEKYKTLSTATEIIDYMIKLNFSRKSLIISIGGGVICDIGGFVASIYMRGIDFIQVPTSLLAQVDASIGGKVAVNHEKGKNLLGFFNNPKKVLIDITFLKTLPKEEFKSGMCEVIKHSLLLKNPDYFNFLKKYFVEISNLNEDKIVEMIYESCKIKKEFVENDFCESNGKRVCLNLGHTYAHALENLYNYTGIPHGIAVAKGVIFELNLSHNLGYISKNQLNQVKELFELYNIDSTPVYIENNLLIEKMRKDKKNSEEKINFVIKKEGELKSLTIEQALIIQTNSQFKQRYLKAVIDIGSNSCRLYIAEVEKKDNILRTIRPLHKELAVSRLAKNINITGELSKESMNITYEVMKKFKQKAISMGVTEIVAFATSATREAKNGTTFVQKIKDELNIDILIISGEMEAKLSFNANNIQNFGKIATLDVGGGSTEITFGDATEISYVKSFPIGVVKLKEMFFENETYTDETLASAQNYLRGFFEELTRFSKESFKIIGVAGTVTTNVSVAKQLPNFIEKEIHNFILTKEILEKNLKLYLSKEIEERKKIVGLEENRADLIISGTLILLIMLEKLEKHEITVSTIDNLDGAMVLNI